MVSPVGAHLLPGLVDQLHLRTQALGLRLATPLRVDNDQSRQASNVVDLLGDGSAFFDMLELDDTGILGDDWRGCILVEWFYVIHFDLKR